MQLEKPLNRYIDHTLLKVDATTEQFRQLLKEAVEYKFASVCVSPHMALAFVEALQPNEEVKVCTVVGFPHGNIPFPLKFAEAKYFAENGVDEIDFVLNVGLLKSKEYEFIGNELEALGNLCREHSVVSKCIVETCYLDEDEKTFLFRALDERTAVDFIKTSTGFGTEGAKTADVWKWNSRRANTGEKVQDTGRVLFIDSPDVPNRLKRDGVPLKIKAAGGIRDLNTALKFIACGADRLGMSASVKVMEEWNAANSQAITEGEETS